MNTTGGSWTGPVTYGAVAAEDAVATIHGGLAAGLNFIDTAPVYGEAEVFIARALRTWVGPAIGSSGRCVVETKCGEHVRPNAATGALELVRDFSRDSIRESLAASRRRLGVDCLDLALLHSPSPDELAGDPLGLLVELRDRGEISHVGVSATDIPQAVNLVERDGRAEVIQIGFNLLQPQAAERLLPLAAERGVGLVIRTPLASGFLTGTLREDHEFASDDYRSTMRRERVARLVRQADAFAWMVEEGVAGSLPEAALRYILSFEGVSSVIAGAMRPEELVANLTAADLGPLPRAVLARVEGTQRALGILDSPAGSR